jgi:hypothetical protein
MRKFLPSHIFNTTPPEITELILLDWTEEGQGGKNTYFIGHCIIERKMGIVKK